MTDKKYEEVQVIRAAKRKKSLHYPNMECSWMLEMTNTLKKNGFSVNGTTFAVLCAIYRGYQMHKEDNRFTVSHKALQKLFFISRQSFIKTLKELEKSGCVVVDWKTGNSPRITLVTTRVIK